MPDNRTRLPERTFITNIVSSGSASRTEIGQAGPGRRHFKGNIKNDLFLFKSSYFKWRDLRQRVVNDMNSHQVITDEFDKPQGYSFKPSGNIAHLYGVASLRRAMDRYQTGFGKSHIAMWELNRGLGMDNQQGKKALSDSRYYGRRLEHLKLFDAIAERMFSKTSKVYENLRGLSEKVFDNVNPNLRDDMLLAQENKLLSVNAWRRKDKSCGLVSNKQSRKLIRQIVASALVHHGYATAKTLKQELTKACELAERSGTNSDFSKFVQARMSTIMDKVNGGALAADAVLEDVELRNVAALAQANLTERLSGICRNVRRRDRRGIIEKALFQVAAKGSLNAAEKFLKLLKGEKTARGQLDFAASTIDGLANADPKEPHYMYMPFSAKAGGIDGDLKHGVDKYREKAHFTIIDHADSAGLPKKPLRRVDPHHVVLLNGHGGYGYDQFATVAEKKDLPKTESAKNEAVLNAERLAERLEQDGLAKNHKVIRLLTCYGGGNTLRYDKDNHGVTVRPNVYDDAFAKRLAIALKQRGYRNIVVGGYPGAVHPGNFLEHKLVPVAGDKSGKLINASGLCRYFDGNGNVVPNPRNPNKANTGPGQFEQLAADRIVGRQDDYKKDEFEFPESGKPKADHKTDEFFESPVPKELTVEDYKKRLILKKPGHNYVANLTKDKFFKDTRGKTHTVPLFADRFRNYVAKNHLTGEVVDAILDIDRLTSMPLTNNNDNGAKAAEAFKQALRKLPETLKAIDYHGYLRKLRKDVEKLIESNDLDELKKYQTSNVLYDIRHKLESGVRDFFDKFHLDLLRLPPADNEIPNAQADSGDVNIDEDIKIEEEPKNKAQK